MEISQKYSTVALSDNKKDESRIQQRIEQHSNSLFSPNEFCLLLTVETYTINIRI